MLTETRLEELKEIWARVKERERAYRDTMILERDEPVAVDVPDFLVASDEMIVKEVLGEVGENMKQWDD